jgi:hypothetical protein
MARWKPPLFPFQSTAPREWATGSSSTARLHQRLVKAIKSADAECADADFPAEQLLVATDELRVTASAIAARLVVVSKLPLPKRQRELLPLRRQVDDVEKAALRIAMSAVTARGFGDASDGLRTVHERLDNLDAARKELRRSTEQKSLPDRASDQLSSLRDRLRRRG